MIPIPNDINEITAAWLSDVLSAGGAKTTVSAVAAERFGEGEGIVAELNRLTLDYAPGSSGPRSLIAKLPSSIEAMRGVAASFGLYEREAAFYEKVASTVSLGTAPCHFARFDPESGLFAIVMADLAPARSGDQLAGMALDEVRLAVESVADLHARWWNSPELPALEAVIQRVDRPPYAPFEPRYQAIWPAVRPWLAARVSAATLEVADRLATRADALVAEMAKAPRTLCHGDFRADNLMFTRTADSLSMIALDWQITMQARGPSDVGYLLGGHVSSELRRAHEMDLLTLYHKRLIAGGVSGYDFETCLYDYRLSMLLGFNYWVQGAAATDLSHDRTAALFDSWARRLDAAVDELGLADFTA